MRSSPFLLVDLLLLVFVVASTSEFPLPSSVLVETSGEEGADVPVFAPALDTTGSVSSSTKFTWWSSLRERCPKPIFRRSKNRTMVWHSLAAPGVERAERKLPPQQWILNAAAPTRRKKTCSTSFVMMGEDDVLPLHLFASTRRNSVVASFICRGPGSERM
jgi:hypothetical protein